MSETVIEATGLTKRYETATAVDGVTFSVGSGEIFGLLGPNGAGKTTTILMLLGLSEISAGTARVFGHDPMREPLAVSAASAICRTSSAFTTTSPPRIICITPRG
jgi:ABC-2 type transport system ATP-binding protein